MALPLAVLLGWRLCEQRRNPCRPVLTTQQLPDTGLYPKLKPLGHRNARNITRAQEYSQVEPCPENESFGVAFEEPIWLPVSPKAASDDPSPGVNPLNPRGSPYTGQRGALMPLIQSLRMPIEVRVCLTPPGHVPPFWQGLGARASASAGERRDCVSLPSRNSGAADRGSQYRGRGPPATTSTTPGTPTTGRRYRLNGTSRRNQHSPNTPTTGLRKRGNDTSKSTGRSGRQNAATRRNMRREERVTVQGPVKKQRSDGMSHMGGGDWEWAKFGPPKLHQILPRL